MNATQAFEVAFAMEMILAPGVYHLTVAIHDSLDHRRRSYHWINNAQTFECRRQTPAVSSGFVDRGATVTFMGD